MNWKGWDLHMRSSNDQLQEIMKRAENVKEKRVAQKRFYASAAATGIFAALLAVVFIYLPNLTVVSSEQDVMMQYGSLLLSVPYMGYVVVGFISFILGICVMLLCIFWKEIKLKEQK